MQEKLSHSAQNLRQLAAELDSFGCELKDPDIGLIDFLSMHNGREIYLCWMLGEDGDREIVWPHSVSGASLMLVM